MSELLKRGDKAEVIKHSSQELYGKDKYVGCTVTLRENEEGVKNELIMCKMPDGELELFFTFELKKLK